MRHALHSTGVPRTGRFAVACQVLALHHGRPSCPSAIAVAVTVADKDGDTFAGHFWRGQTLSVIRTSCRRHLIATSCPGVYMLPRAGPWLAYQPNPMATVPSDISDPPPHPPFPLGSR